MIFEIFTDVEDENQALWNMWHIEEDHSIKGETKKIVKKFLSKNTVEKVKSFVKK